MERKGKHDKTDLTLWTRMLASKYVAFALFIFLTAFTLLIWKTEYDDSIEDLEYDTQTTVEVCAAKVAEQFDDAVFSLEEVVEQARFELQVDEGQGEFLRLSHTPPEVSHVIWLKDDMTILQVIPSDGKYVVGEKYSSFLGDNTYQTLTYTLYDDNEIKGYIIGKIDVVDLILSTMVGFNNEYRVEIYDSAGKRIGQSANWEAATTVIEKRKKVVLDSTDEYTISLVPNTGLITDKMRTSIQILYYGLSIALGAFLLMMFVRKIYQKSRDLERAKNEMVKLTDELKQQNIVMEEHLRDKQRLEIIGVLASSVAHEINNPINGIMNYGQIIIESNDKNSETAEFAREIIEETQRVSVIIKNMLQFSRQRHQNYSYARPEDIIRRTQSLMKTMLNHDNICLNISIDQGLPSIQCNSQHIQQVLMNLLTNAQDALNEKYLEFNEDKCIMLYCGLNEMYPQYLRITVEDHGDGIPEDIQNSIYAQFFTTKGVSKGTGLGLYITKSIVEDHDGILSFETEEGKYTRFHVDIPIKADFDE